MSVQPRHQDFDWVPARSACSPFSVFVTLRGQVEKDVDTRNAVRKQRDEGSLLIFSVNPGAERFTVVRDVIGAQASISFHWKKTGIEVRGDSGEIILAGALTLNDDAECRLKVGEDELAFWQFRRRALENLFFGFEND